MNFIAEYAHDTEVYVLTEDTDIAQESGARPEPRRARGSAESTGDTTESTNSSASSISSEHRVRQVTTSLPMETTDLDRQRLIFRRRGRQITISVPMETTDLDREPMILHPSTRATPQRSAGLFLPLSTASLTAAHQSVIESRTRRFDIWFISQNDATRELVTYAAFRHYVLSGSTAPLNGLTPLSPREISNTTLKITISRNRARLDVYEMESGNCRTLYDFVDTLTQVVEKFGIGGNMEAEMPKWEGAALVMNRLAIDNQAPEHMTEAEVLGIFICESGVARYNEWWLLKCTYRRRPQTVLGTVYLES